MSAYEKVIALSLVRKPLSCTTLSVEQLQAIEAEQRRAHPAVAAYPVKH